MKQIMALCLAAMFPLAEIAAQPPAGKGYQLLFEDNFDGDSVNTAHWHFREGRRTAGTYINGLNFKENVRVRDGILYMDCRTEQIDGKKEYTGGGIISNANFGYGYYECKSRPFMEGRGVHTSFWQFGGAYPNSMVFEIDSYEIDSKSYGAANNLYVNLGNKEQTRVPWPHRASIKFTTDQDGWWVDAYEYTPEGITFYDNGKIVAQCEWPELNAAQQVWLSTLNGCGKVEEDKQPGYSAFDYFRYYTKDYPGVNRLPNGNFEFNQDLSDPYIPKCWKVEGTPKTVKVVPGNASRDNYKVRFFSEKDYQSMLIQELTYIMDGEYLLSAMVRSSGGQQVAEMAAYSGGKREKTLVKASDNWTKVALPVCVTGNRVTIELHTVAEAGQWLEFDDINFMKPAVEEQKEQKPFALFKDAIWSIGNKYPVHFTGNGNFYFFDRCVGLGDAVTIDFTLNADVCEDMIPISRMPQQGKSGWAVCLTKEGGLIFEIGSLSDHIDVAVSGVYKKGEECSVRCVYSRGTASVYVNGKLVKKQDGIVHDTADKTAPGRMGSVDYKLDAANDVVVEREGFKSGRNYKYFRGTLSKVSIYNKEMRY